MKKIFLILFASLFAFTQCGKDPETNNDDTKMVSISGKIDTDNGKSDIAIPGGNISWKGEESIFIAVPAHGSFPARLVEMKNTVSGGNIFVGEAPEGLISDGVSYEIWYFGNNGEGSDDGSTNVTNIYGDGVLQGKTISFKEQTGLLENIGDFHVAKGTVSFVKNNNTGNLTFSKKVLFETQMTIAYMFLYPNKLGTTQYWNGYETYGIDLDINSGNDYNTLTLKYNNSSNTFEKEYSNITDGNKIGADPKGLVDISIITEKIYYGPYYQPSAYMGHNYIALLPQSKPHFYFGCMGTAGATYILDYQFEEDIISNQIYTGGYDSDNSILPIYVNGDHQWNYPGGGSNPFEGQ